MAGVSTSPLEVRVRDYLASRVETGESFVTEREISEEFQINRSNSRKLLLNMEGEGLLMAVPQRGYRLLDYRHTETRTLYNIRSSIEREAARLAAKNATREDVLRMMLILDESEKAVQTRDQKAFTRLDIEFHHALIQASHDLMVIRMFRLLTIPLPRHAWDEDDFQLTHDRHRQILDAVRAGDAKAAEHAAWHHLGHGFCLNTNLVSDEE